MDASVNTRPLGRKSVPRAVEDALIADYLNDKDSNVLAVAERHGVTKQTLYNILRRNQVDFKNKSAPASSNDARGLIVDPEGGHVQSDVTSLPGAEGNGEGEKSDE